MDKIFKTKFRLPNELLIENMLMFKVEFPNLQGITLNINGKRTCQGIRHFNQNRLPSIKYYNQDLNVKRVSLEKRAPFIRLEFKDGTQKYIEAAGIDSAFLWEKVVNNGSGVKYYASELTSSPTFLPDRDVHTEEGTKVNASDANSQ